MNRTILTAVFAAALVAGASAQIMKAGDAVQAPAKVQGGGSLVPWLNFGIQSTQAIGYNLDTGASGMAYDTANAHPDVNTSAWFTIALLDGVTDSPLMYKTAEDSEDWKTTFTFKNFSARLHTATSPTFEFKKPMWKAELRGQGFRFGLMSQAGRDIGTTADNNPVLTLTGANQVTNLNGTTDAAANDYVTSSSDLTVSFKGTTNKSGLVYAGYEAKDLFATYLTVFSEGNVGTDMTATKKEQGWAFALEGTTTPMGLVSEANPFAPTLKADVIKGFGFQGTTNNPGGNTGGFGLGSQFDFWVAEGLVLSPQAAFDGRLNDIKVTGHMNDFEWQAGGGLMVQLGEPAYANDDWNELKDIKTTYITNKIRKVAYLQALGMYSDATDLDLAFKAEEPDGNLGIDENWGSMVEYRLNNVNKKTGSTTWSATGRVSYDLLGHTVVPYVRFYANGTDLATIDKTSALKLRTGVQLAFIDGVGFEITYMSPQVLGGNTTAKDSGKIEFIATFKTDGEVKKVFTPKTMYFSDFNK